jgi:hypothetical protein
MPQPLRGFAMKIKKVGARGSRSILEHSHEIYCIGKNKKKNLHQEIKILVGARGYAT